MKRLLLLLIIISILAYILAWIIGLFSRKTTVETEKKIESPEYVIGQKIDSLNGVYVYYNGEIEHVCGRNTTADGYNLGLKYQCVEFVKRYYYQHLKHKMPDSYGHAKDFFDKSLKDGQKNKRRNLTQYSNPSRTKPKVNDLIVFEGTSFNKYGHVAIISKVTDKKLKSFNKIPVRKVQQEIRTH